MLRRTEDDEHQPLEGLANDALQASLNAKLYPTFRINAESQVHLSRYVERVNAQMQHSSRMFIVTDGARYLVQQRPARGVNGGFWEFPNSETDARWAVPENQPPLTTARHSITRYRIQLKAYLIHAPRGDGQWCTLAELRALPFTAAHRKLLPALTSAKRKAA